MAFLSEKLISASGGATEETDDDFNLVTGLYHFDGSNGAQNNTLLDSSPESHTVTRNADIVQGTFSPFSAEEGKWGVLFEENTTSDHLTVNNSDFAFGTGDFTAECFIFLTGNGQYSGGIFQANGGSGTSAPALAGRDTTGLTIYSSSGQKTTGNNGTIQLGVWYHIALVRASSVIRVYVDGSLVTWSDGTTTAADTTNVTNTAFAIGKYYSNSYTMDGFISNFRVVTSAVYTGAFTKPTTPLTDITNTVLLTCRDNRFRDASSEANTVSIGAGTPRIQPFSPFAPSESYSASAKGGSGYFDQSSDCYLTVSDSTDFDFGTGDYTLEAWVYRDKSILGNFELPFDITGGNNYWGWTDLGVSGYDGLTNHVDAGDQSSGSAADVPKLYEWTHVVYQVTSGNNNWYVNGVRVYNASANTQSSAATGFQVGRSPNYNNHYFGGFISDVRIIKGSNAYSNASTLTVPTAPLTAVTNTKLLLNFTNAAMFDQTGKTNTDTVGNAQLDTSVKKFGTASLELDGTSDYLEATPVISPDRGSWTYECFIYPKTVVDAGGYGCIFSTQTSSPNTDGVALYYISSTKKLECYGPAAGGTYFSTANDSITLDQWQHVALVFDLDATNYPITCYVNGTSVGSSTTNTWQTRDSGLLKIGAQHDGGLEFTGFIDEFRATLKARYTSNFTAPTKEFPNL